ncbi:unnamed protein product [Rhizophagus irregularis]|uniref:Uncharacterized protein n=1 Tax=Rhizophagus irregularis TaxID=588596 RepID=A0A915ZFB0_9GLOM|nr:unnamed protein product [Rhizophagus irregularis]
MQILHNCYLARLSTTKSIAKHVTGIGLIAAVLAAPFTGGVSLIVSVTFAVENLTIITATNTVCNAVARWSAAASSNLNYKLQGVREEFSQYLRVMHNGLDNIINIISHCEFYWERQIVEIEDIIIKLEQIDTSMTRCWKKDINKENNILYRSVK